MGKQHRNEESLFRRVTKYRVGQSLDPAENRLTEVTASVLERVDGLAQGFVEHLLEPEVELRDWTDAFVTPRIMVATQVATQRGGFVDLEVVLESPNSDRKGLLLWVEVKRDAPLTGDQLSVYSRDIETRASKLPGRIRRAVVLLAPRGWQPDAEVPSAVLTADWQGVGRIAIEAQARSRPPEQSWLLSEYICYLGEEGLIDPDALTKESALSLMRHHEARDAAAGICDYADRVVSETWSPSGHSKELRGKPAFGGEYWANYDFSPKRPERERSQGEFWLEWGLRDTSKMSGLDSPAGSWAFMAGVTFAHKDGLAAVAGSEWLAARINDGFESFELDGYPRVAKLCYPDADELLRETTLEAQGRYLGGWITDAFSSLVDNPPAQSHSLN